MDTVEGLRQRKQGLQPIKTGREANGHGEAILMEEDECLSPVARLFHKPENNIYILTIIGLKTKVSPDVVKENLVHTLLKHPRFSSLQVPDKKKGGELKWVRTKVDLEKHVIVPDLDEDMDSPDKFVEDYVRNLSRPITDMSKPLWDLHILNIKTSQSESSAVLRVHHSLGDGTSLMSLLLACTRKTSDPNALPTIPVTIKKQNSTKSRGFWSFLQILWNTFIDVLMFLATILFLDDSKTPLTAPPGVSYLPHRIIHRSVSLDDIKLVKNAMGTTINDVVVAVSQAALSRYLNRRYAEGKKDKGATEKNNNLPKNIRFRTTLFMNLRPAPGIHALADMMGKGTKAKWGNEIGYVIFPFKIALRDNPLDYVREAKAHMDRKKVTLEATCTCFIAKIILKYFHKALSFTSHTTMWYSNVPGPSEEVSLFGYPVAFVAPTCFGQPNALMIHCVSYANKMTFILSVEDGTIPDPHQLCDDLEESFKLIKDAVIQSKMASKG